MSQSKPNESTFNRRLREKQESRDADRCMFESGEKSVAQLNAENARFAIPGAVVDFGGAKRLW